MDYQESHGERRRHLRYSLALPVNVHLAGRHDPVTVEIVDIGAKGVRFRLANGDTRPPWAQEPRPDGRGGQNSRDDVREGYRISLDEQAAFGFVIPGQHVCVATGKVMRIVGGVVVVGAAGHDQLAPSQFVLAPFVPSEFVLSEFVLSIERANDAFHGFLVSLAH